ncbi:MAG: alanine/glycine:cation symporter family protein [Firmicutes bacterium]|nr:alanine/glycine:cation symporter family protein [Bacillota bacterium]MDY5606330.1 alanine/glycine:cation symporter family protein [Lentihominibacter sp.]
MAATIDAGVCAVSNILYQPWFVPLLLIAGGIYLTVRCGFMQVGMFREACRVIVEKPHEGGISSFGALMVSTASRVGTGNIIGVSTAIILGGPGAIFWMWITAFFGGASAFVESTLAQIFKKRDDDGSFKGGPAFYMRDALGQKWLGVIFSILIIFTYMVGYNMLASYNLQSTFAAFSFYDASLTPKIIGVVLAVLFAIIVLGGAKRLIKVTEVLVPVMGVMYVLVSLIVLALNITNLGHMFAEIFSSAFDFEAIFGGFTGSCIMWGVKRGLYSNEAGMGSAPNAAAKADVSHPAKQGLVQMLSVFIDTLLICTATAFMCLSTDVIPTDYIDSEGAAMAAGFVQDSLASVFGGFGPAFIAIAMCFFAFTTLIGNYSYCEGCYEFIIGREASKTELVIMRIIASILVFIGAVASAGLVWDIADMMQGLMVVTNVPTILILGGIAFKCLDNYKKQMKEGINPIFKARDIGITVETDWWK